MKKIEAKIIADSMSPQGHRITTFHLTFPRHILAELNTHRMFSRNSASSRAIPFAKMVKMVEEDPFIPIAWQKDHSGMQGKEYFTPQEVEEYEIIDVWKRASQQAIFHAKELNTIVDFDDKKEGVTKQIVNRLLEPFMWHSNLVTTTDFENFFVQRCPQYNTRIFSVFEPDANPSCLYRSKKDVLKDFPAFINFTTEEWVRMSQSPAEIHMQALAEAMWDAFNESTPNQLKAGEWHLPYGEGLTVDILKPLASEPAKYIFEEEMLKVKIVSARCARTSYNNFDGTSNPVKDIKLSEDLQADRHRSPLEHAAKCPTDEEYIENIKGVRTINNNLSWKDNPANGWFNNFHGWIPYRFMIEEEEKKGESDGTHRY